MSKDFITNSILQSTADAIRYCDKTTNSIAPKDFADRIRELDKLIPQPDALNFYMPNGGTISLNKTGNPTVVELEYWLNDNGRWIIWQEDANGNRSLTLTAGQTVYIRNTSVNQIHYQSSYSDYYNFSINDSCYADGKLNSFLCKNPNKEEWTQSFTKLFYRCTGLITAPILLENIAAYPTCFAFCSSLLKSPVLQRTYLNNYSYYEMFYECTFLNEIRTYMTDVSAQYCLSNWLNNVSPTGDFYCPASLTIPTGASGIPNGWTRHDI